MKLRFLGTGTSTGVPVLTCKCEVCQSLDYRDKRTRTSLSFQIDHKTYIIDAGPDFRAQCLNAGFESIDAILFTHQHKDHTGGLDDIRPFNYLHGLKQIPVYGSKEVLEQLKHEYHYIFSDHKYPGAPLIDLFEISESAFEINNIGILPIPVLHHKLPVLGYRIGNVAYITDANYISEQSLSLLKDLDILILNALQIDTHISHFNLEEAVETALKIGAKRTYFTHIAHKLGLHATVEQTLPQNMFLAFDGLELSYPL